MSAYVMHYNAKAGEYNLYDPRFAQSMKYAPVCKIRGRKDVTADLSKVTCGKCAAKAAK